MENILIGIFDNYDIPAYITELQPATSDLYATDTMGGWSRVLNYCKGEVFANECGQKDFIIIALDTDRIHEINIHIHNESVASIVKQVVIYFENSIKTSFGNEFYETYRSKLIFAIAVDAIECWLLPLLYLEKDKNTLKTKSATKNCKTLIEKQIKCALQKKREVYDSLSRGFMRQKTLFEVYAHNPSLQIFIENLPPINP